MADSKRKLIIEVLGNAKDATQALGDVRSNADRTAEKLVSFGTVAVTASAAGAVGLYKLAGAASDYGESVSAAEVIFKDGAGTVVEFGEAASETAGLSKQAAVDGANTFGTFGKSAGLAGEDLAGFSTEMVQLAGDLASFKNTTPEQAIEAIGAALRGEAEPIRAYGVLLDDATLKARALEMGIGDGTSQLTAQQKVLAAQAEILAQTGDAQGDFVRTSDSLANQQRILKADLDNLAVGIGQGVLPMVSSLVGGASSLTGAFSELSPETQGLVGQLGGIAVVGVGAVGSLSFIAGKALEARDRFTQLGDDGERSLNKTGKAAAGLGVALTGIALGEIIGQVSNQIGDYAQKAEDALNATREALLDGDDEAAIKSFGDTVAETQAEWTGWGEVIGSVGREMKVATTGVQADIENVDLAFKRMLESSPQAAQSLVEALERQLEVLDPTSREYSDTADMVDRFRDRLDASATASDVAEREQEELAGATGETKAATEEATSAWQEYADTLAASTDPIFAAIDATDGLEQSKRDVMQAQAELSFIEAAGKAGTDEHRVAVENLNKANADQVKAAFGAEEALAALAAGVDEGKVSYDNMNATLDSFVARGVISAEQAQKVRDKVAGVHWQVGVLDNAHANIGVNVDTSVAMKKLQDFARSIKADPFWSPLFGGTMGVSLGARADGGPVRRGRPYLVGEEGPELIIPDEDGTVITAADTARIRSGAGAMAAGPAPTVVHIPISITIDGPVSQDSVRWVRDQLEQGIRDGLPMPLLRDAMAGAS
jgi:hypothetical protein